MSATNAFGYWR